MLPKSPSGVAQVKRELVREDHLMIFLRAIGRDAKWQCGASGRSPVRGVFSLRQ